MPAFTVMRIAIKMQNPKTVAAFFGECAGDYAGEPLCWWVGEPSELYPSRSAEGAKVIAGEVRFCGGSAWLRSRRLERRSRCQDRRGLLYGLGWAIKHAAPQMRDARVRGWAVKPEMFRLVRSRPLPLP